MVGKPGVQCHRFRNRGGLPFGTETSKKEGGYACSMYSIRGLAYLRNSDSPSGTATCVSSLASPNNTRLDVRSTWRGTRARMTHGRGTPGPSLLAKAQGHTSLEVSSTTGRIWMAARNSFRPTRGCASQHGVILGWRRAELIRPSLEARILDCCQRSGWTVTELSKSLATPESSILTILRDYEQEGRVRVSSQGVWTVVKTKKT